MRFGRFIELEQIEKELAGFEGDKLLAILEKRDQLYKPRKVFYWLKLVVKLQIGFEF